MDKSFIILHRKILESEIYDKPPHYREVFLYLLLKAFFADGEKLRRGQWLTSYGQIIEDLSWRVGYRKQAYKKHQCEKAMKWLVKAGMIETTKTTRGLIVTICNYSSYQDNRKRESDNEGNARATTKLQCGDTIDNNTNNNTNNKYNISVLFDRFWKAYPKREGSNPKKPALDKFSQKIKKYDPETIIEKAHKFNLSQGGKITSFVPQAVTWLNQERFNDELEPIFKQVTDDEDLIAFFEGKLDGI
jgi:hypothetical protein